MRSTMTRSRSEIFGFKITLEMPAKYHASTKEQWQGMSRFRTKLEGYLNGKKLIDYTLAEAVSGKVGVWSKTDSISYFDDFTVVAAK